MKEIVFVTGNQHKINGARRALAGYDIDVVQKDIDLHEIQASHTREIAEDKARRASQKIGEEVICADSGLYIEGCDGFPGPYTSYVEETLGAEKLLTMLEEVENRSAEIVYVLSYADAENGVIKSFHGGTGGRIAIECRGKEGMLIDFIFIPAGYEQTLGELKETDPKARDQAWAGAEEAFAEWYQS